MQTDRFYELVGVTGIGWLILALLYALLNYLYDVVGCWLTGGQHQMHGASRPPIRRMSRDDWQTVLRTFHVGGKARVQEFRADTLSWLWPVTVLAIPTFLYGLSHGIIGRTVDRLVTDHLSVADHRLVIPFAMWSNMLQYGVWTIAIAISFMTFWQYRNRPLDQRTWFAKSDIFHFSRILIFNSVLSYMVITTLLVWFDFMAALYRLLGDEEIVYKVFHPDLLYGLRPAYDAVIVLCVAFLAITTLPVVMLIREREQRFSKVYYLLIYAGVLSVIITGVALVYQFNLRLEVIQGMALGQIVAAADLEPAALAAPRAEVLSGVWYFDVVSRLPGGFPVPRWLEYLVTARIVLIPYEIYLLAANKERATVGDIVRRVLDIIS